MVKHLFILRHGLAVKPGEEYGAKVLSAELLPEAIPVIERLGGYLTQFPCQRFLVSPVLRCQQTAAIVTQQTGQTFANDDRLREYHNESFAQLHHRVEMVAQELQSLAGETVWICTHGAVIGGLKNFLLKGKFEPGDELDYPFPGSLCLIENQTLTTIDFNFEPPHRLVENFERSL
jgi:broad specificity phosphatase PhoE